MRRCPASDSDHLGPWTLCGSFGEAIRESRRQLEANKIVFMGGNVFSFMLDQAKRFPNSSQFTPHSKILFLSFNVCA